MRNSVLADRDVHEVPTGSQSREAESFELVEGGACSDSILSEITDFLDGQDTGHPFQFPQWASGRVYRALYRRNGRLCWYAQASVFYPASRVLRSVRALAVNRGPVSDHPRTMEAGLRHLVDAVKRKGIAFIEIIPEWTGNFADAMGSILQQDAWVPCDEARTSLRLDLKPEPEQVLASFRKVTRYEIRRSERLGVEVRMARTEEECEEWLRLHGDMAREKHFDSGDASHMRRVLRWLVAEPQRGGLELAWKDGRLVGGIVVVRSGKRCWYIWGATTKNDVFSPGHLLQWKAIQWARSNGCREYDFCGYRAGTSGGTAFFKSGFCTNIVQFVTPYRYVVSRSRERTSQIVSRLRQSLPRLHKA